jgi:hypothetical protein
VLEFLKVFIRFETNEAINVYSGLPDLERRCKCSGSFSLFLLLQVKDSCHLHNDHFHSVLNLATTSIGKNSSIKITSISLQFSFKFFKMSEDENFSGFSCDQCDDLFLHPSGLERHKDYEHGSDNENRAFKCTKCHKSFNISINLDVHKVNEHSSKHNSKTNTSGKKTSTFVKKCAETSRFICKFCGKIAKKRQTITTHLDLIHGKSTFKHNTCHLCPKKYGYRSNLRIHLWETHGPKPETSCVCRICDEIFIDREAVIYHIKKCHIGLNFSDRKSYDKFIQDNFNFNFPKSETRFKLPS